jgi:hypothetical protein
MQKGGGGRLGRGPFRDGWFRNRLLYEPGTARCGG